MQSILKNIITETPTRFSENVYLLDAFGNVLAGRSNGKERIKNVFDLIDESDKGLVFDNLLFYGLKPLQLVNSSVGPIYVDCSLYADYSLILAIIPHFSANEVVALTSRRLLSRVRMSESIREALDGAAPTPLDEGHEDFASRILSLHRGELYYGVHGKTNASLALMMSEIAHDYSGFLGCELNVSTVGLKEFDLESEPDVKAYVFALVSLCILARNYSAHRSARLELIFDDNAIYFEFGFSLANMHKGIVLGSEAPELIYFRRNAEQRFFKCIFAQDERAFAARCFPIYRSPDSSDIKEKKPELIYDD